MHLILTGATGLVGSGVLDAMIKMKDVTQISILSRRPVKMAEDRKDPRVNVIIHKDFNKYDSEVLSKLKGATGCVWALGISQTQVSKEDYIKITKDYALEAAKAFQELPSGSKEPFNFVYVSGHGSTFQPGRFTPIFGKVKGETELALAEMRKSNPLFHASSIRPAAVDASEHDDIKPYLPQRPMHERILRVIVPVFKPLMLSFWSPTEHLGKVAAEIAMGKHAEQLVASNDIEMVGQMPVLENTALRRLAGLKN